jgi:aspartate/methionine/tyrosine aminotransferase
MIINSNIIEMEYAVRGPIPQKAAELKKAGRSIIFCNIGNPQALGQKPISFYRQVLSVVEDPQRLQGNQRNAYPDDVPAKAEFILSSMESGMGAYTESRGPAFIREAIARFIDQRDGVTGNQEGVPSNPDHIFITNGASDAVKSILEMIIAGPNDGIMIPIPQYPLYSAAIKKYGGVQVNYYPDEDQDWNLTGEMLEEAMANARRSSVHVKAIVAINPGNPTGAILNEQSIAQVIRFAEKYGLAIIADEVYQENVYDGHFTSFAKMVGKSNVPLFSLHSVSKGFYGECGHRGGYVEVRHAPAIDNAQTSFIDIMIKQASVSLCSNTVGQVLTYLMVSPPTSRDGSFASFQQERTAILAELYEKATIIKSAFQNMDGMRCFGRIGALYLFPRMDYLPAGTTDYDYCMSLLNATGLCTVNGMGFGQKVGTHHLRIAFLPPKSVLEHVLPAWVEFHNRYVRSSTPTTVA